MQTSSTSRHIKFVNILDRYGNGDIAFLYDAVGNVRHLVEQHIVVFLAIPVVLVALQGQQYRFLKRLLVHLLVADGDFGRCVVVERIKKLRIVKEHRGFIVLACNGIVNIGKAPTLAVLVPDKPNTVEPYPLYGNDLLHRLRDIHALLVLLQYAGKCFNHRVCLRFSFSSFSVCSDSVCPAYRVACSQSLRKEQGNGALKHIQRFAAVVRG